MLFRKPRIVSSLCLLGLIGTVLCSGCMKVDENLNPETHSPTSYVEAIKTFGIAKEKYLDCMQAAWTLKFEGKDAECKTKFDEAAATAKELETLRTAIVKNDPSTTKQNLDSAQREVERLEGMVKEAAASIDKAIQEKDSQRFRMGSSTYRGMLGNRIEAETQLAKSKK